MDEDINNRKHRLEGAANNKDIDRMLRLISGATEAASIRAYGYVGNQAKAMRGRGTVTVQTVTKAPGKERRQ